MAPFSFRCYRCGFVFHDGLPPIEALSQQQVTAVPTEDMEDRFSLLEGTMFEGLSTYHFCAFCLTVIRDYYSGLLVRDAQPEHKIRWQASYIDPEDRADSDMYADKSCICACGELVYLKVISGDESFSGDEPWERNRACILHHVRVAYPNADLSELEALKEMRA